MEKTRAKKDIKFTSHLSPLRGRGEPSLPPPRSLPALVLVATTTTTACDTATDWLCGAELAVADQREDVIAIAIAIAAATVVAAAQ